IAAKVIKDESPDILSKAYDLADPKLVFGVNGDISEAAYNYTANFLQKVGFMTDPVPYDKFFDRRFVNRVLQELGRMYRQRNLGAAPGLDSFRRYNTDFLAWLTCTEQLVATARS